MDATLEKIMKEGKKRIRNAVVWLWGKFTVAISKLLVCLTSVFLKNKNVIIAVAILGVLSTDLFLSKESMLNHYGDYLLGKIPYISSVLAANFGAVVSISLVIIILVFLKILWQYKKATDSTGKNGTSKEKVRLEFWLATFGALVVGIVLTIPQLFHYERIANRQDELNRTIADRQSLQNEKLATQQNQQNVDIANQQAYRSAIDFLSSRSPAVRLKGVEDLYEYAKENNTTAKEIWKILNDHLKYFTRDKLYQDSFPNGPARDIALIMEIQSSVEYINKQDYPFKDMRNIDWESAWLRGANLESAPFRSRTINRESLMTGLGVRKGAQLQGANLSDAQLQGASLVQAQLQEANLRGTQLHGAYLFDAQLRDADLENTQLHGANLQYAQLRGANLSDAQLQGAYLRGAQLQGAYLQYAQLQGAYLGQAQLQEANLRDTQLHGVFSSFKTPAKRWFVPRKSDKKTWFITIITRQIGKETEVNNVIFEGGITIEHLSAIEEKMDLDAEFWEINDDMTARHISIPTMRHRKVELEKLLKRLKEQHSGEEIRGTRAAWAVAREIHINNDDGSANIPATKNARKKITINDYLKDRGAVPGAYPKEEADKWIADYKKAVGAEE